MMWLVCGHYPDKSQYQGRDLAVAILRKCCDFQGSREDESPTFISDVKGGRSETFTCIYRGLHDAPALDPNGAIASIDFRHSLHGTSTGNRKHCL